MLKSLPIGYEDIREIVDKKLYYVDKSLMIKELLGRGGKVNFLSWNMISMVIILIIMISSKT